MMNYSNRSELKDSLKEYRRQLEWCKKDVALLESADKTEWTEAQADEAEALIRIHKQEMISLETTCRSIETELKKLSLAVA